MSRASQRNNVLAGGFLIGALALAVTVSFILGEYKDKLFSSRSAYTVEFTLDVGAEGIEPGAEVHLGGQKVGEVKRVETGAGTIPRFEGGDPDEVVILVGIEVDDTIELRDGVRADLVTPLFGQLSTLNFSSLGPIGAPELGEDARISGRLTPGMLTKIGLDPEVLTSAQEIVESVKVSARRIESMLDDTDVETRGLITNAIAGFGGVMENAESITGSVRETWPKWESDISSVLANAEGVSAELGPLVLNANRLLTRADNVIRVNEPDLRRVVLDVNAVTSRVRHETMDQITGTLGEGRGALASAREIGDEVNVFLDQQVPRLRRAIENVQLMSEEGRAAAAELRAQPWRLTQQPSAGDLENEPFYNAARAYARAAADLQNVSSSLESVVIQAGAGGAGSALVDPAQVRALSIAVNEALERYERAEASLFEHIRNSTR